MEDFENHRLLQIPDNHFIQGGYLFRQNDDGSIDVPVLVGRYDRWSTLFANPDVQNDLIYDCKVILTVLNKTEFDRELFVNGICKNPVRTDFYKYVFEKQLSYLGNENIKLSQYVDRLCEKQNYHTNQGFVVRYVYVGHKFKIYVYEFGEAFCVIEDENHTGCIGDSYSFEVLNEQFPIKVAPSPEESK